MPLEERIEAWSKQRPAWQRIVLQQVAVGNPLSADALDQLIDAVVAGKRIPGADLEVAHLAPPAGEARAVSLGSISDPTHVNALSATTPLTFPRGGLTVVYGDNGSGKSGYARLLKRVARSRHSEDVLTDVFRDTNVERPTANLGVHIGEEVRDVSWPASTLPELQHMLFYDSFCGSAYIASEGDFPYRPYALFAMDGLIDACVAMRGLVDAKLQENARAARQIPSPTGGATETDGGRFLSSLSADSAVEELDALIARLQLPEMSIDAVESQEATLRSTDTRQARRSQERNAQRLDALRRHIEYLDSVLGAEATDELMTAREAVQRAEKAAEQHANVLRSDALPGIGSSAWQALWESARRFSEKEAYPEHAYPVADPDSRCVLCLQALGKSGRDALSRLDRFVKDDIQVRRTDSLARYRRLQAVTASVEVLGEVVDNHLRDLEISHSAEVCSVRSLLAQYKVQKGGLSTGELAGARVSGVKDVIERLSEAEEESRRLGIDLGVPELAHQRLRQVAMKRHEIGLLQDIKSAREAITAEIGRLSVRRRLEDLKQATNTGPITRKVLELSEDTITEVIRDRFTRESDRLGLDRVTIAKTRGSKGALLHQPKLVGARQSTALSRVFSEGERTALGLAAYFTEASLDQSESALILDDPVTSLDHIRRERVAIRLLEFAETRQVIVFTHDVAFVAELKGSASRKGVAVAARWVSRSRAGARSPGSCVDQHPWKAKDVPARLDELRVELARIRKQSEEFDDQQYEAAVAEWGGKLSETWERIFSQEVVGQVLADGGMEVRPMMVRILARFTNGDYQEFDGSYGRATRWARRHDKSAYLNYVPPPVNELQDELDLINQWFKRVRKYKSI